MKNKLAFWILFLAVSAKSQLIEVMPVKNAGIKNSPNLYGFFTVEGGGIYHSETSTKDKKRSYILEKYNDDLTEAFQQTISFEDQEGVAYFEVKANKIYLFTTAYDGKDKTLNLRILDNTTGNLVADKKIFGTLSSDPFGVSGRNFVVSFSPDNSKLMIISAFQWNKKPQVVKADIYDFATLKLLNTVPLPDTYHNFIIKSSTYQLFNDGSFAYLFVPDIKEKEAPKSETAVLYNASEKSEKIIELPLEKKVLDHFRIITEDDKYILTGIFKDDYSKKDNKENKAGVFNFALDVKTVRLSSSNFEYFPSDLDTKLSYKDGAKKKDLSEKDFSFKGLVKIKNGYYLIENLTYTKEIQGQNTTYIKSFSRDIIVTKFNMNGKVEFVKALPKYTTDKMYDFDYMVSNDHLYFFYAEHPKNLEKFTVENYEPESMDDVGDLRGPVAVCVKVDANGTLTRQNLYDNETWCYYPGCGIIVKKGSDLVVMNIQKNEYALQVFRIKK